MRDLAAQRDRSCGIVDAIAAKHLDEGYRNIADLQGLRRELSTIISSCAGGAVGECRILEAFAEGS